ncbi:MAG: hypothetical protein JW772_04950 [Candidatus Diapherotrites archaeon]|nr:hypothetical protein [Candidatus Diapherotrites archaeon]
MKLSIEAMAVLLIIATLFTAVFVTQYWHTSPMIVIGNAAVGLIEYPKVLYADENACFTIEYLLPTNSVRANVEMEARTDRLLVSAKEPVEQGSFSLEKTYCFPASELENGENIVEINAVSTNLFFHIEKLDFSSPEKPNPIIEIQSIENKKIIFSVQNFDTEKVTPIEIFINGELHHRVFPKQGTQEFEEKIDFPLEANTLQLKLGDIAVEREFSRTFEPVMPFIFGIIILVLAFSVFVFFVFSKQPLFEKLALSLGSVFAINVLLSFILAHLNLLSFCSFMGAFAVLLALIAFFFRKNFSQSFGKLNITQTNVIVFLALLIFFTVPVFFQIFTSTHVTYWNGFYERSSASIAESFDIPTEDKLSYFGRGFTFIPGYFLLDASFSWITGLNSEPLFAIMLTLASLLFLFSALFFASSVNLTPAKAALFIILVSLQGFFISALTYSPRHVLSFALFLLALAVLIKKDRWPLASLFLAIMAFIQVPMLAFFPIFYLIVAPKIDIKKLLKTYVTAIIGFGILFLPNLLQYGFFRQALSEEWGYLIDYSVYYFFIDVVVLLMFAILFYGPEVLRRKIDLGSHYRKKLLIGLVFGVLLELFVVYRWNLLTAVNLALLIAVLYPEKALQDRISARLLAMIMLVSAAFVLYSMTFVNVHEIVLQPAEFIGKNTETNARLLSDPMYGHVLAFIAERSVLSDLHVEYADERKLLDTYAFLEDKDYSVIQKYGIDYTVNQVDFVHRKAIGNDRVYGVIEFEPFDKIYSNGFIFVHRVR